MYLLAVEKGFSKPTGFEMLTQMKARYTALYSVADSRKAKAFSLNAKFQGEIKALHVQRD